MSDLSITALYTSQVWAWAGLSCAELFATTDGKRVFDVTNAALAVMRRGTPLRYALLHRHAMIDHLVRASAIRRVIELAAGLSRRGAAFTADPQIDYVELDLPAVVARKRELLQRTAGGRAVLARANYQLVAGDIESVELAGSFAGRSSGIGELAPFSGGAPVLVIAEGLAMYLDAAARGRLFGKLRRLADDAGAVELVFDLVPTAEEPPPGVTGRLLEAAMKRFTGGRTFERDATTRAVVLGELRDAGFADPTAIAATDVAHAWGLPHADRPTPTVVFTARAARSTRS
jgi:O-methyltransferase involved in polyketide biosynthesis